MLVLTRRVGERIYVGDDIIIEVVEQTTHGVRLGVTAPRTLQIDREEVHTRKLLERALAPVRSPSR